MTGWIGKEDVRLAQLCTDFPFDFGSRDYYKHAEQASDVAGGKMLQSNTTWGRGGARKHGPGQLWSTGNLEPSAAGRAFCPIH
jgi:hypothetical protein